eukprot:scaffold295326_cov33-Prasinocladus_malaysianus.AAC.1
MRPCDSAKSMFEFIALSLEDSLLRICQFFACNPCSGTSPPSSYVVMACLALFFCPPGVDGAKTLTLASHQHPSNEPRPNGVG